MQHPVSKNIAVQGENIGPVVFCLHRDRSLYTLQASWGLTVVHEDIGFTVVAEAREMPLHLATLLQMALHSSMGGHALMLVLVAVGGTYNKMSIL